MLNKIQFIPITKPYFSIKTSFIQFKKILKIKMPNYTMKINQLGLKMQLVLNVR